MIKTTTNLVFASAILAFLLFFPQSKLVAYNLVMSTNTPQEIENDNLQLPETVTQAVKQDIVDNNQVAVEELTITEAEKELWANGCLELAKEGEFCTQAIVPGWRVLVTGDEQTWVYRTDETGRIFRLEE